ncbi:MAG: hypothetical protein ACE5KM_11475 [Planctomycetaceae bacterium]
MNCDEAFESLTDPIRRNSDELNRHLNSCGRCRQMQDVLAPAINLLAPRERSPETGDWDSGLDLETEPMTRPAMLPMESIRLAERTAADLARQRRSTSPARRLSANPIVRYAAVFLLGAGITWAATAFTPERRFAASQAIGDSADCLWVQQIEQREDRLQAGAPVVVASCVGCHRNGAIPQ